MLYTIDKNIAPRITGPQLSADWSIAMPLTIYDLGREFIFTFGEPNTVARTVEVHAVLDISEFDGKLAGIEIIVPARQIFGKDYMGFFLERDPFDAIRKSASDYRKFQYTLEDDLFYLDIISARPLLQADSTVTVGLDSTNMVISFSGKWVINPVVSNKGGSTQ